MNRLPTVDVIMSGLDEEHHIGRCLDAVLGQDHPRDLLTVYYVDGGSTDRTLDLVRARAARDPRLHVVPVEGRINLPAAMNIGIAAGTGDLIAKVDVHGWPDRDFIRRGAEQLASAPPELAVVGGRPVQSGETPVGEAVARARTSRFGTGGSIYSSKAASGDVDSVQCGTYRRSALAAVGGFDESMAYGEDDELNWRLRESGYRIRLDERIRFHYVTRPTLGSLYRQYRRYGEAKVRVARAHPGFVRPWHAAPLAMIVGGITLAGGSVTTARLRPVATATAGAYLTSAVLSAARTPGPRDPRSIARVAACFACIHAGYGLGALAGIAALARAR